MACSGVCRSRMHCDAQLLTAKDPSPIWFLIGQVLDTAVAWLCAGEDHGLLGHDLLPVLLLQVVLRGPGQCLKLRVQHVSLAGDSCSQPDLAV